jgi:hypothetical protein
MNMFIREMRSYDLIALLEGNLLQPTIKTKFEDSKRLQTHKITFQRIVNVE